MENFLSILVLSWDPHCKTRVSFIVGRRGGDFLSAIIKTSLGEVKTVKLVARV